ncbi:DUF4123 domain-containing protein [Ectopseudomonas hydrolytica]|uniref:DUF4123 domain-containing protein n=1 Tax=Ectopseudomonas hydrolytica TaxID=2493633 RepID=UPI00376F3BF8
MIGANGFRSLEDEVRIRLADNPELKLFALVDGARYLTLESRLDQAPGRWQWLLAGTELDAIKQGGPALLQLEERSDLQHWLVNRDRKEPLVSWLLSTKSFEVLSQHLGSLLFTRLPDGRKSLFRYYNPVVRRALDGVLDKEQRQLMMRPIEHWLVWQPLESRYLPLDADTQRGQHA